MDSQVGLPRSGGLTFTLVAGLALLTSDALFAQNASQSSDVSALQAQMNQMQRQYEQRIEAMEAKMKALESNVNTGSILNTRVLTDANGTEEPGKAPAPMLDESFLKSLTRNFSFNVYMRAGFQFNGSGGAGTNTQFNLPDKYVGGGDTISRLGNEPGFYTELSWNQAHLLGDSPDVADVSFRATMQAFSNVKESAVNVSDGGGVPGAGVGMVEGYAEMKNVFKNAPEITFWGGNRFYDRYNIDSEDYFWLNTSGFGVGVYNIHLGPGTLWFAWLGNDNDNLNVVNGPLTTFNADSHVGNLFKQTLDLRYKDIDIGFGKLSFILIGNYVKGDTFETTQTDIFGVKQTGILKTQDMWGIGGGAIWTYDFGNKSELRISGLYGYGATDFQGNIGNQIGQIDTAWINQINRKELGLSNSVHSAVGSGGVVEPFVAVNPVTDATEALATAYFVWNPTECFSMGIWANWEYNDNQTIQVGFAGDGSRRYAGGGRNIVTVGIRPVYWIADNIAIQGAAGWSYINNVRTNSGSDAFGADGDLYQLTIAPTIKPKGGFFTRPEIRVFATWARWSSQLTGSTVSGNNPPYNHTNQGWLLGSQMEIWF